MLQNLNLDVGDGSEAHFPKFKVVDLDSFRRGEGVE